MTDTKRLLVEKEKEVKRTNKRKYISQEKGILKYH